MGGGFRRPEEDYDRMYGPDWKEKARETLEKELRQRGLSPSEPTWIEIALLFALVVCFLVACATSCERLSG